MKAGLKLKYENHLAYGRPFSEKLTAGEEGTRYTGMRSPIDLKNDDYNYAFNKI